MYHRFHIHHINKERGGFSLIELMVSLSVFAIVMVVSTGTLITLIDANAKAQALNTAMTNLSFGLDSMTREMRMGYSYNCFTSDSSAIQPFPAPASNDCTGGKDAIAFYRERDGKRIGYRLQWGTILQQKIEGDPWKNLLANDVIISTFKLVVKNTDPYSGGGNNTKQPTIDFILKGYVNNGLDTDTDFNIQTHIVQRRLDIL
ncbi:prepilin-type N-terminal cleavage/methylation domain-containing protein [Candidatus Kaiserbacteria bacterium]|nr:MAG: prepilin-type N-terminal cleavage/methylation domain-containing protein [Candidatus Kaiserbacteria bacterium]